MRNDAGFQRRRLGILNPRTASGIAGSFDGYLNGEGARTIARNKDAIHGDLNLGARDTVYVGEFTGAVNAKTNKLFEFSSNFGNQTINKFQTGSGSTADIIQFTGNDFSSFAKVRAASTQQGSDLVIQLDATDSIAQAGVVLSSLVAANHARVRRAPALSKPVRADRALAALCSWRLRRHTRQSHSGMQSYSLFRLGRKQ